MYDSVKRFSAVGGFDMNIATYLVEGMSETIGAWPAAAGMGMIGNIQFNPTFQFFDDEIHQQTAMALVMHGRNCRLDTTIMHGCRPASGYHTVTRADRNVVLELDGHPALDAIARILGPDSDRNWEDYPLFVTLGVNKGDKFGDYNEEDYANRLCMAIDKVRGGLVMFEPDLEPGTEIQLMRRAIDFEYIDARARRLYDGLGGRTPFLGIYIDCMGRAGSSVAPTARRAPRSRRRLARTCRSWACIPAWRSAPWPAVSSRWTGAECCASSASDAGLSMASERPDDLAREAAYYRRRLDELAGESLKLDYQISGLRKELRQKRQAFTLLSRLQRTLGAERDVSTIIDLVLREANGPLGMDEIRCADPDRTGALLPARRLDRVHRTGTQRRIRRADRRRPDPVSRRLLERLGATARQPEDRSDAAHRGAARGVRAAVPFSACQCSSTASRSACCSRAASRKPARSSRRSTKATSRRSSPSPA